MTESNYKKVVAAIPDWKPTRYVRVFGVTAIKEIVTVKLLEAVAINKRLISEGVIPGDSKKGAKTDLA